MDGDPDGDDEVPGGPRPRDGQLPVGRAAVVLALFVLATVLLLGLIHPTTAATSSVSSPAAPPTTVPSTRPTTTTTTTPKAPSHVPVLVANASGVAGAAAAITNQLQVAGWTVVAPVNASARVPTSHVYYVAGQQAAAQSAAAALHLPASSVAPYTTAAPVSTIGTAEVLVVLGPDLAATVGPTTTIASGN